MGRTFKTFQDKIPFLRSIPRSLSQTLSTDEFFYPKGAVSDAREYLEEVLDGFVMTYKRNVFRQDLPLHKHLCAQFKGASLTTEQKTLLHWIEEKFSLYKVSFVVYQKPLTRIAIEEGPF